MSVEKLSVSLPTSVIRFLETYKSSHQYKSRSYVIELALRLLQEKDLEDSYRQPNAEIDAAWEVTSADGLSDETW